MELSYEQADQTAVSAEAVRCEKCNGKADQLCTDRTARVVKGFYCNKCDNFIPLTGKHLKNGAGISLH